MQEYHSGQFIPSFAYKLHSRELILSLRVATGANGIHFIAQVRPVHFTPTPKDPQTLASGFERMNLISDLIY